MQALFPDKIGIVRHPKSDETTITAAVEVWERAGYINNSDGFFGPPSRRRSLLTQGEGEYRETMVALIPALRPAPSHPMAPIPRDLIGLPFHPADIPYSGPEGV